MKLPIQSTDRLKELLLLTLLGVIMYISQVIMAPLPNIELVSFLIIVTARKFRYKSFISVYVFVGCELLTYGFSIWAVNYMYVWAVLTVIVCLLHRVDSALAFSLLSAIFGLIFGSLCSIPYFITGGLSFGLSYIVSGIGFDIAHCVGNFLLTLILYRPVTAAFSRAVRMGH